MKPNIGLILTGQDINYDTENWSLESLIVTNEVFVVRNLSSLFFPQISLISTEYNNIKTTKRILNDFCSSFRTNNIKLRIKFHYLIFYKCYEDVSHGAFVILPNRSGWPMITQNCVKLMFTDTELTDDRHVIQPFLVQSHLSLITVNNCFIQDLNRSFACCYHTVTYFKILVTNMSGGEN